MIKIVIVEPNKAPYAKEIENTVEAKQAIVGGYIEAVRLPQDFYIIVNEEGKLQGLEPNRMIRGFDMLVGTFFITKSNHKGDFVSLTDQDAEAAIRKFTPLVIE